MRPDSSKSRSVEPVNSKFGDGAGRPARMRSLAAGFSGGGTGRVGCEADGSALALQRPGANVPRLALAKAAAPSTRATARPARPSSPARGTARETPLSAGRLEGPAAPEGTA